ncbi:MAG: TolC family protein [Aquabacterium sp.]|uniref:TolC family protein n=1 Tax=Aquabacterium sp. TaxID=1872578 RepID=UPI002726FEDD|nr:TolC family protein [Aquabacterium sp.]MDO9005684.1 TolC family protein [Aquabacterium sp.]
MAPLATLAALTTATLFPSTSFSQVAQASPAQVPLSAASAPAPTVQPLTLAEAIRLALQFSPQIVANQQELAASDGTVIQAGARPNPEIQALIEDTRRESRTTTVQFSQPIELGGKRSARVSVAELGRAQTAVDVEGRRAQIRADVSDAFFGAVIAQERVQLAQASAELSGRAADAASKRVQAGKISPVDETRAKVAHAGVRVELRQAQGELRSARQRLSALLGPAAPRAQVLAWQSNALPALLSPDTSLTDVPALRQARLEVDRRQAMVELERARRIPDMTLTLGAKRDQQVGRNQTVIGLSIPIPVLDTNRGNLLQALRLHDKAEADLQATRIRVETEWTQLSERQRSAQAEVQAMKEEVLPGAESAWQAATTGFELGKFSFLDALDAQRTLFQARAQYLRALNELYRTTADIDRLLGTNTDEPSTAKP